MPNWLPWAQLVENWPDRPWLVSSKNRGSRTIWPWYPRSQPVRLSSSAPLRTPEYQIWAQSVENWPDRPSLLGPFQKPWVFGETSPLVSSPVCPTKPIAFATLLLQLYFFIICNLFATLLFLNFHMSYCLLKSVRPNLRYALPNFCSKNGNEKKKLTVYLVLTN